MPIHPDEGRVLSNEFSSSSVLCSTSLAFLYPALYPRAPTQLWQREGGGSQTPGTLDYIPAGQWAGCLHTGHSVQWNHAAYLRVSLQPLPNSGKPCTLLGCGILNCTTSTTVIRSSFSTHGGTPGSPNATSFGPKQGPPEHTKISKCSSLFTNMA